MPSERDQTLSGLVEQVRVATGLDLEASIRWVSPAEQRSLDEELDRRSREPGVKVILLGSASLDRTSQPTASYEGYWALVLPGQETMVYDDGDFASVIEEYVTEEVWGRTGRARKPGFLRDA